MKNDWSERKGIISVLLVAALTLWGYNGYQVFRGVRPAALAGTGPVEPHAVPMRLFRALPPPYVGDFRDPFARPGRSPSPEQSAFTSAPPAEEAEPEPPPPLPLRLTGTVGETALLMDEAGRVHLVRAGEEIGEVRIRTVGRDSVTVEFDQGRRTLALRNDSGLP